MAWYRVVIPNRVWLREFLIIASVLSVYFLVGIGSPQRRDLALGHCEQLIGIEEGLGIFCEVDLQRSILDTAWVPLLTSLYIFVHPLLTLLFVVGFFLSGSRAYPQTRNVLALFSLLCFAIFYLYPSAPPRMLVERGFVDLLEESASLSYEMDLARKIFNPYAAMPSIHFGYSLVVGATILLRTRWRLVGIIGIAYPSLMLLSVTASANHLFIDCGVAVVLLGVAYFLVERVNLLGRLTRIFKMGIGRR